LLSAALLRQIARHENRRHRHYLLHYYPLSIAGGAVFFTQYLKSEEPAPSA
jgi:hypothetical protein